MANNIESLEGVERLAKTHGGLSDSTIWTVVDQKKDFDGNVFKVTVGSKSEYDQYAGIIMSVTVNDVNNGDWEIRRETDANRKIMTDGGLKTGETRHPKKHVGCSECDAGPDTWQPKRKLPQIGQTHECLNCGHEVYVYDAGGRGGVVKQWRPVTSSMATSLLFFSEVGDWPDSALERMFKQGLERAEAIDYHIVEKEGLSQSEWATKTERSQPSVSENVSKARSKLGRPTTPTATVMKKEYKETDEWAFYADVQVTIENPNGFDVAVLHTYKAGPKYDDLVSNEAAVHQDTAYWWPDSYPADGDSAFRTDMADWEPVADLEDNEQLFEECLGNATFDPEATLDALAYNNERVADRLGIGQ